MLLPGYLTAHKFRCKVARKRTMHCEFGAASKIRKDPVFTTAIDPVAERIEQIVIPPLLKPRRLRKGWSGDKAFQSYPEFVDFAHAEVSMSRSIRGVASNLNSALGARRRSKPLNIPPPVQIRPTFSSGTRSLKRYAPDRISTSTAR